MFIRKSWKQFSNRHTYTYISCKIRRYFKVENLQYYKMHFHLFTIDRKKKIEIIFPLTLIKLPSPIQTFSETKFDAEAEKEERKIQIEQLGEK